jgi:hypothetical protein
MIETDSDRASSAPRAPTSVDRRARALAPAGSRDAAVRGGAVISRRSGMWAKLIMGVVACALVFGPVAVSPASVAAQQCQPPQQPCPPPPPNNHQHGGSDHSDHKDNGGQQMDDKHKPRDPGPGKPGQDGGRHGQDGGRHGRDTGRPDLTDLAAGGAGGPGGAGPDVSVLPANITQQTLPVNQPAPQEPLPVFPADPVDTDPALFIPVIVDPVLETPPLLVPSEETTAPLITSLIAPPSAPELTMPIAPPPGHSELTWLFDLTKTDFMPLFEWNPLGVEFSFCLLGASVVLGPERTGFVGLDLGC